MGRPLYQRSALFVKSITTIKRILPVKILTYKGTFTCVHAVRGSQLGSCWLTSFKIPKTWYFKNNDTVGYCQRFRVGFWPSLKLTVFYVHQQGRRVWTLMQCMVTKTPYYLDQGAKLYLSKVAPKMPGFFFIRYLFSYKPKVISLVLYYQCSKKEMKNKWYK